MTPLAAALAGPIIWALHFFSMYATQTAIAAQGGSITSFRIAAITITAFAITAIGFSVVSIRPDTRPRTEIEQFLFLLAAGLSALSVTAVLWTGLAAALLDSIR